MIIAEYFDINLTLLCILYIVTLHVNHACVSFLYLYLVYKATLYIYAGEVTLRGRKFWEKVKTSNMLNYEWYHLQDQRDNFSVTVPSPLYSTL